MLNKAIFTNPNFPGGSVVKNLLALPEMWV